MMQDDDDDDGNLPDLSNREILRIMMQEIVDVRNELKEEFSSGLQTLDQKLSGKIDALSSDFKTLKSDFKTLRSDFYTLKLEVHQNQSTFIVNHADLEKRVMVLETA